MTNLSEAQHRRDIKRQRRRFYMLREGRHEPSTQASDFVGRGEHNSATFSGHDLLSPDAHVHPAGAHGEDHQAGGTDEIDADIDFTPAVLTDWDGDADPGDLDDALDQLAERIDDTEALEHAAAHTLASHSAKAHADLSDAPADAHHAQSHGASVHSGKIGEVPITITIPLSKPLPSATANATLDDDWLYKSPWSNEAQRISRWYIRFESNLAANATFQLFENGSQITGAEIAITSGQRDGSVDSFTEVTLADGDSLEVHQTVGNAEDIGGRAYVYGDQDVVTAVTYA